MPGIPGFRPDCKVGQAQGQNDIPLVVEFGSAGEKTLTEQSQQEQAFKQYESEEPGAEYHEMHEVEGLVDHPVAHGDQLGLGIF